MEGIGEAGGGGGGGGGKEVIIDENGVIVGIGEGGGGGVGGVGGGGVPFSPGCLGRLFFFDENYSSKKMGEVVGGVVKGMYKGGKEPVLVVLSPLSLLGGWECGCLLGGWGGGGGEGGRCGCMCSCMSDCGCWECFSPSFESFSSPSSLPSHDLPPPSPLFSNFSLEEGWVGGVVGDVWVEKGRVKGASVERCLELLFFPVEDDEHCLLRGLCFLDLYVVNLLLFFLTKNTAIK